MAVEQPARFRVEIGRCCSPCSGNHALVRAAHLAGLTALTACRTSTLYFLQGSLSRAEAERLAETLLADPVTESYVVSEIVESEAEATGHAGNDGEEGETDDQRGYYPLPRMFEGQAPNHTIDVTLLPGVTDPAAENVLRAARTLGIITLEQAATGQRHLLCGKLSGHELRLLATSVCSNPVVQRHAIDYPIEPPFVPFQQNDTTVEHIPLRGANDASLREISTTRRLALDLNEMQAIRTYFEQEGRDPSDAELETLAQTWSEHCVHKTFRALIDLDLTGVDHLTDVGKGGPQPDTCTTQQIDGLLRTLIRGATERVAKPWVRSAFVDNAGIIAFDEAWDLAFKVETHNHPSALEPFGGANTGVGGVVRDILGVSARPIANTDVLCFGPPDLPPAELPHGVLHPRRIAEGVIHGIEDYGNKMGIPTVNGAICYHSGYTANPLVFCGCLGLLPRGSHPTSPQPHDLIVVIGGRTGRDGLRGATFSSMEMDQTTSEIAGSAVQIGHPINEKQIQEVVLRARDEQLYHAITDCGAGGLASAVGEMGQHIGARVQLETVPLKYPGLRPWEIWLSEAQERMVLAVPAAHWPRIQEICAGQDVEAVCIGEFEPTERLRLFTGEIPVGDLAMTFLHNGIPRRQMKAAWTALSPAPPEQPASQIASPAVEIAPTLLALLAHPDIRSKEAVVRRYDHEVQGGTVVKPLVGTHNHGPGNAAVLVPLDTLAGSNSIPPTSPPLPTGGRGVALSVGIAPAYGEHDPYAMAWAAIDEAMRNLVAVGGDPDYAALLDNFCWGNPTLPDRLGSLVRCAQGCYDGAIAYNAPFISGKDSLNNEYTGSDGRKHAIPGTLLISAVAIVPDVSRTVTMDLKAAGNLLYLVGDTREELAGSHYAQIAGNAQGNAIIPPQPVPDALERLHALHGAIAGGLVQACHDCSEGGIGVALAEMSLAGALGATLDLASIPGAEGIANDAHLLFSESLCRFLVEVRPADAAAFESLMGVQPWARAGEVVPAPVLRLARRAGSEQVEISLADIEMAWRGHLASTTPRSPAFPSPDSPPRAVARPVQAPRVLVLHANGTNRDRDAALACELAGASPEVVHINQLLSGERRLLDYAMMVIPGGFSYGDDLGAGKLWSIDLRYRLEADMSAFVESGRPMLGICNGFQALVKAGLLPGRTASAAGTPQEHPYQQTVTLAPNTSGHFECRWVYLQTNPNSPCLFIRGQETMISCPVAHGEGRLAVPDDETLQALLTSNLAAIFYTDENGAPANGPESYPTNPNGSAGGIAGLCNPAGNVLGLMPHPENHIFPWQHPRHHRGERGMMGLWLFEQGVKEC